MHFKVRQHRRRPMSGAAAAGPAAFEQGSNKRSGPHWPAAAQWRRLGCNFLAFAQQKAGPSCACAASCRRRSASAATVGSQATTAPSWPLSGCSRPTGFRRRSTCAGPFNTARCARPPAGGPGSPCTQAQAQGVAAGRTRPHNVGASQTESTAPAGAVRRHRVRQQQFGQRLRGRRRRELPVQIGKPLAKATWSLLKKDKNPAERIGTPQAGCSCSGRNPARRWRSSAAAVQSAPRRQFSRPGSRC